MASSGEKLTPDERKMLATEGKLGFACGIAITERLSGIASIE